MAVISNIVVDAGSTFNATITVKNPDGTAFDLTDYTVASQIRKSYGSSTAYDFNPTITDATAGQITLSLSSTQSEAIAPGRWLYDVEITNISDGAVKRVVEGIVTITPQITKI